MVRIANSANLATYESYDLAWLAPITYPLVLAMAVLGVLLFMCARERRQRYKVINIPPLAEAPPCLSTGTRSDRRFSDHSFHGQKLSGT